MPRLVLVLILPLCALLGACTGTRPLPAPPEAVHGLAEIPGYPGARYWGDDQQPEAVRLAGEFFEQVRQRIAREGRAPNGGRFDSLVLSGGGSDGPFGAGLLVGMTEAGIRPEFAIVTGISAGALIAPFAFLGPEFDDQMREFTATGSTETLVTFRILGGLLDGIGLIDNSKLRQKLRGLITPEVVNRIADEHEKGRRLIVGTTNLDAQRPVYWRISRIAQIGRDRPDETADLITKIIIASASIPGAFPPQFFTVEAGGERYSEMHVDGGVTNQLFFVPRENTDAGLPADLSKRLRPGTIYIVRNTRLSPDYAPVEPGIVQTAARAISTLIKFGGRSDVIILQGQAVEGGFGVRVTAVPDSFQMAERELFDPAYMQALFEVGRGMAGAADTWYVDIPPGGFTTPVAAAAAGRPTP